MFVANTPSLSPQEEWKPRGRDVLLGNVPWLARVADKARAKAEGTIGEYIYP